MVPDEEESEMMKGRKHVLAWITAVMMCLTLIGSMPVTVSAQPDTKTAASEHKVQNGTEVTVKKEKQAAIKTMESSGQLCQITGRWIWQLHCYGVFLAQR